MAGFCCWTPDGQKTNQDPGQKRRERREDLEVLRIRAVEKREKRGRQKEREEILLGVPYTQTHTNTLIHT